MPYETAGNRANGTAGPCSASARLKASQLYCCPVPAKHKIAKDLRKLAAMQLATAEAQKRTDASLHALIGSLRGGGNGHATRRVD